MVRIVTDSSVLYTKEEAEKMGFDVMPLCVNIGDLEDRDLQVDMDEFYGRIAKGQHPKSSQPPIGEVIDIYEKYAEDDVINIAMADGLSGTYQSAYGATQMVDNGEKVTVFNSRTLCGPHRYMVEKAQKMKLAGKSAKEILEWLEYVVDKHESFLIPQDFDFLRRGGRLTPAAATVGSILKLKPVMTQTKDGKQLEEDIKRIYELPGGKDKYWDEVSLRYAKENYEIEVRPCTFDDIVEIDSYADLKKIDSTYQ